jgi:hypothetical protein
VIYDFVTFHVLLHNQQAFNLPKRWPFKWSF